jgi:hypothetical protein
VRKHLALSFAAMMQLDPSYILHLTFASVGAVYCLLGYWLAFGKEPWMWRAGSTVAALALLVPIRAYEPLVFFALISILFLAAAGAWWLLGSWRKEGNKGSLETNGADAGSPQPRFQFRLHDLLGLMAVFGAAAWMARTLLREQVTMPWIGTFISAAVAVAITLATIGLLRGPRRIVAGTALAAVLAVSVGYFHSLHRMGIPVPQYIVGGNIGDQLFWSGGINGWLALNLPALNLLVLLSMFILLLSLTFFAAQAIQRSAEKRWRLGIWQMLVAIPCAAWLLPTAWLYWQLLSYPRPPAKMSEGPNSLPRILQRGQPLESMAGKQARALAAEIIDLSKQPGYVRVPWDAEFRVRRDFENNWLTDIQTARSISRGLDAQATALEKTNPNLAAEHLMAIVRMGDMEMHRGLLIHGLVGIAYESIGIDHLVRIKKRISVRIGREIIADLEAMEKSRDHNDIARDQLWYSLNDRWAFRLDQILNAGTDRSSESSYFHYGVACKVSSCRERLLRIDLALRAYRADHEKYPPTLESLVPQHLSEIPLDPFSNQPFVYRPATEDFVLYSVGGDAVDNGGRFGQNQHIAEQWTGYDMDLDTSRW